MNGQLEKWKEKLIKGGKHQWLVCLLAGLIFLVISIPSEQKDTEKTKTDLEVFLPREDKTKELEQRLEEVLGKVSGVGKTKVFMTLKSDGKKLVEKDNSLTDSSKTEATVYERDGNGTESPYVTEKIEPEVAGVLVVAEGGNDPVIISGITGAVQALFGIEAHKIKVMKMDEGGKR